MNPEITPDVQMGDEGGAAPTLRRLASSPHVRTIVAVLILLVMNLVKDPGYLSISYNADRGALAGNVVDADGSWYVDAAAGDLHLEPGATAAIDQGVTTALTADIDGDGRPHGSGPDVGADERLPLPSLTVGDVSVLEGDDGTVTATFTVTLSESQ